VNACVLDANIAVKWFLPPHNEELVDRAFALLDRHEKGEIQFLVPDLFWAEAGNIFWKAVRLGRCSKEVAERSIAVLKAGKLITVPSRDLLEDAFAIATGFDRSFYDSLYIALAVESRTQLVTADEKLINALKGRFPVRWLGSL
jgi:predicted nucleic acid-binding protein